MEIQDYFEQVLRPKIRTDGGDMVLGGAMSDLFTITAHADCASCPAASHCFDWVKQELEKKADCELNILFKRCSPYFVR